MITAAQIKKDVEDYLLYVDDEHSGAIENAKTDYFDEDFDVWLEDVLSMLKDNLQYECDCKEVLEAVRNDPELLAACEEEHASLAECFEEDEED